MATRPYAFAAGNGAFAVASLLIEDGADVNAHHQDEDAPIHFAAEVGALAVVSTLIEAGADVKATGSGGNTALHDAAREFTEEHLAVVSVLIEAGIGGQCERLGQLEVEQTGVPDSGS